MRELYIVGAGGHGREILDVVEAINAVEPTWAFKGFVADGQVDEELLGRRGAPSVATAAELAETGAAFVIAIGDGRVRSRLDEQLTGGRPSPSLVHPHAVVDATVALGEGVLVPAGCVIGGGAQVGRHATVNVNVAVAEGCRLGSYSTVSPGCRLGIAARLGDGAFLGVGATADPGVVIGPWATVGAGAHVDADILPGASVAGQPARPIRSA